MDQYNCVYNCEVELISYFILNLGFQQSFFFIIPSFNFDWLQTIVCFSMQWNQVVAILCCLCK